MLGRKEVGCRGTANFRKSTTPTPLSPDDLAPLPGKPYMIDTPSFATLLRGSRVPQIQLGGIDYAILLIYFSFVLGIGWALRRYVLSSEDFFLSGRSIPTWIAGLAFLSANLGAQEVIGMAASGAKYGMMTSHFYWVGAIPAMVLPRPPGPSPARGRASAARVRPTSRLSGENQLATLA